MAAIINVCTIKGHHCFLITIIVELFFTSSFFCVDILGTQKCSESHFLYRQSGGEQIQFPLFGKKTVSFIEKERLPNAYLIDYNTIKYVFRRRAVQ